MDSGGLRRPWEITQEERVRSPYYEAAGSRTTGWLGATARVAMYGSAMGVVYGGFSMFTRQIQEAKQLEQSIVDLKKVMEPDSNFTSIFDEYWKSAIQFGRAISEVAEIGKVFAQQGLKQKEIIDLTRIALIGMNSAELSAAESVEFLTSVYNTWGIEAEKSIHFIDKVMAVQAKFAVTAKELTESSMVLSPVERTLGGSFDEMLGDITAIKEITRQPASRITTGLKTIYGRFSEPSYAKKLKDRWGIAVRGDEGIVSPSELWGQISERYKSGELDETDLFDISKTLGGVRHFHYILSLIKNYDTALEATRISENANMEAQKAADLQMQTTAYQWMAATNAIKEFGIAVANLTVLPVIREIASAVKSIGGGLSSVTRQRTWLTDAVTTGLGVAGAGYVGSKLLGLGTKTALTKQLRWVGRTMVSGQFTEAELNAYLKQTGLSKLGISAHGLFGADDAKYGQFGKHLVTERDGVKRMKMTMPGLGWFQMYGPGTMAQAAGLSGAARRQYNALMRESFLSMFDMLNYEPYNKEDGSAVAKRMAGMFEYQDYGVRQAARLGKGKRTILGLRRPGGNVGMAFMLPTMIRGAGVASGDASGFAAGIEGAIKSTGRFSSMLHALPGVIRGIGASLAGMAIPAAAMATVTALLVLLKKVKEHLYRNNIEFKKTIDFSSQNSKEMGQFLAKLTNAGEDADPTQLWITNKDKVIQIMNEVHDGGIKTYQDLAGKLNEISGKANLFDVDSAKESWIVIRRFLETEVFAQYGQILEKMRKDASEKIFPDIQKGIMQNVAITGRIRTASFMTPYGRFGGDAPVYTPTGLKFSGFSHDVLQKYYGPTWSGTVSNDKEDGVSQIDELLNKLRDLNKRYGPGGDYEKKLTPKEQVTRFSQEALGKPILLTLRDYFTSGFGENVEAARALDAVLGKGAQKAEGPEQALANELQKATMTGVNLVARQIFGENLERLSPEMKKAFEARTEDLADSATKATMGLMDFSETLAMFKGQFHGKLVDWMASLGKAIARNEEYASIGEAYSLRQEAGRIGKEGMLLRREFDIDMETGLTKSRFVLDYLSKADKEKTRQYFKAIQDMSLNKTTGVLDDTQVSRVAELWAEARGGKLEDLEKAIIGTEKELKAAKQEKMAAEYSGAIADSIYTLARDLAILGSEVAMTLEKESIKIWKESAAALADGEMRWAQAREIPWNRAETFANKLAQIDRKGALTRLTRGLEWEEKALARQASSVNPMTGEAFVPHQMQLEMVSWERDLSRAETDRLIAVDRLNAAIDIQTEVTREYSEALSQAKGILSSTFSDYKTIYGTFFGGMQELASIDAQIAELRRQGGPEAATRITDLEREKKNIQRQRPKPLLNLLEGFAGSANKSLFDDAVDLFAGMEVGGNRIGDFLAKFMLGPRAGYLQKEGYTAEAMYEDAKAELQRISGASREDRMHWIAINQWRVQEGILQGVNALAKYFTGHDVLSGIFSDAVSPKQAAIESEPGRERFDAEYYSRIARDMYGVESSEVSASPRQQAVDAQAKDMATGGAAPQSYDASKMAGYMALANIAGNIGGSRLSQSMGRTGEYAGIGASIGSGLAMALGVANPIVGIGLVLGGSLLGALASPKLDTSIDRNTQAVLNNTAAIEKLSSAIFHAPTTFTMPRSMLGDIGNYDVGFDRLPARPTILPG